MSGEKGTDLAFSTQLDLEIGWLEGSKNSLQQFNPTAFPDGGQCCGLVQRPHSS